MFSLVQFCAVNFVTYMFQKCVFTFLSCLSLQRHGDAIQNFTVLNNSIRKDHILHQIFWVINWVICFTDLLWRLGKFIYHLQIKIPEKQGRKQQPRSIHSNTKKDQGKNVSRFIQTLSLHILGLASDINAY